MEVERSEALAPAGQGIEAFKKAMDARYQAAIADLDLAVRRVEAHSEHLRACSPGEELNAQITGAGDGRATPVVGNDGRRSRPSAAAAEDGKG